MCRILHRGTCTTVVTPLLLAYGPTVGTASTALALMSTHARRYGTSAPALGALHLTRALRAQSQAPGRDAMQVGNLTMVRSEVGRSDEDAFGEQDPLEAIENALPSKKKNDNEVALKDESRAAATGDDEGPPTSIADAKRRRRRRRKQSIDSILGDVLHDALLMRDMGQKPTSDFVYKRAQERFYEEEYGHRPPSMKEVATQYMPFPPDFNLHRLIPLYAGDATAVTSAACGSPLATSFLLEEDPWPERAVTAENPVWTKEQVEKDKVTTKGEDRKEWEKRMFSPREGYDAAGEFLDAMDELAYWETKYLRYIREVPLSQRRSLPYLHEFHRIFVHRLVRAERRYITTRNVALAGHKSSASVFARSEDFVERIRSLYSESHRALASPNYDPLRMKRSQIAVFMRMNEIEFEEWLETQRQRRNSIIAELS